MKERTPHDIEIRKIPFAFTAAIAPIWNPALPEWSHMVNGASLTMPYLEPFLIKNLREALPSLDDAGLHADARAFIGQEAQHYTNHRRYNEILKNNGYPELAGVEAGFTQSYESLAKRSLAWRLAYSAGFETMTMGLTRWLIDERQALFGQADPIVASFILWHMVEETEHKSVAFDVYQAVSGSYLLRVWGLIYGSFHVGFLSRRGYRAMLMRDGQWTNWRSRLALWRMVGRFFLNVGPAMLQGMLPNHHPDDTIDPDWIDDWRAAYGNRQADELPILDTGTGPIAAAFARP